MKNNISEKMVCVKGFKVVESKVEGRLKALAFGRRIKEELQDALNRTRQDEADKLREAGFSASDITMHFYAQDTEAAINRGFIYPTRVSRTPRTPYGEGILFH